VRRSRKVQQKKPPPAQKNGVIDVTSLIAGLRAGGSKVEEAGEISQPFFSVQGRQRTVDGENVQAFEYASQRAADREAKQVSPDGSSVGSSMVSWGGTPHFYKKGKLIVLYVGDDQGVLRALRLLLGTQFAGGQGEAPTPAK
jgi:hypothetical protein